MSRKKSNDGLCQLCGKEPGVHRFDGLVPALIGDECLKRAHVIRDDAIATRAYRSPRVRRSAKPVDRSREGLTLRRANGKWVYETASERHRRLGHVAKKRKSRARPPRPCRGCGLPIVRVAPKGPRPVWCDGCNPHQNRRRYAVPVVMEAVA